MVSIDPGHVHNGTVWWSKHKQGWQPDRVAELFPSQLFKDLASRLGMGQLDLVVCEEFRLYPKMASDQGYSIMPTCEVIGVIKYLAKAAGIPIVMQPASIKVPTMARAKAARLTMVSTSQQKGQHCLDAELHGVYWLATNGRFDLAVADRSRDVL